MSSFMPSSGFQPSEYSYGVAEAKNYAKEAGKEAQLSAGLAKASAAAAAVGAAAAPMAPPWSLIVTAAAAATAVGLKAASAMSGRNAKALKGDEAAIVPFIKKANRIKAAKRKQVAVRLLKQLAAHKKKKKKGRAWKVRDNVLKMKLAALYAVQQQHGERPNEKLDPDGPTPAELEAKPDGYFEGGYFGVPTWGWIGGGLAAAGAVALALRGRGVRAQP